MLRIIVVALTCLPTGALAHGGTISGGPFAAGLFHPVSGLDHVLAMVGVGLWAGILGGRARVAMPLCFLAAMLAGWLSGVSGPGVPGAEPMIVTSVIVLGAAAALALRPALPVALALLALFGAAHGLAHGAEGPAGGPVGYAVGFALTTAGLMGAGLALGRCLMRWFAPFWVPRAAGLATAAAGLGLSGGAL